MPLSAAGNVDVTVAVPLALNVADRVNDATAVAELLRGEGCEKVDVAVRAFDSLAVAVAVDVDAADIDRV